MKVVPREDESGISEVIGTILILAMTVVLFSAIIVWVSAIPTPSAQTRLDVQGTLNPICSAQGYETAFNVTLLHNGGESLADYATAIYLTYQAGSSSPSTDNLRLQMYNPNGGGSMRNGLLDGTGTLWSIGERWFYARTNLPPNISCGAVVVSVTVVDTARDTVVWSATLSPPAGSRPPVFLNVWASRSNIPNEPVQTPESGVPFFILAQVTDPDGDLNPSSVTANLTFFWGSGGPCAVAVPMYDDGPNGGHQDVAIDGVFTLFQTSCMSSPPLALDGSLVLFSAKDLKGHVTSTRMVLHFIQGPEQGNGGGGIPGSGRPPNLHWNGNQGYNIFNASEWDAHGYQAKETRTFYGSDTVVVVVGSLNMENVFGIDTFRLWDPYSGVPQQAVVYGSTKTVTSASLPSSTSAFSFFQFVNGYYVYTYRFKLNDPTVGINYYTIPPARPQYYYYARYPLSILLGSSTGNTFTTADSINITAGAGTARMFPILTTYSDASFSHPTTSFTSTSIMYVQVQMLTTEANNSQGMASVALGNIQIQDYSGGYELNRAPSNGYFSNLPICPPTASASPCTSTAPAVYSLQSLGMYRFAVNLARVNQDPWVAGTQNYAFLLTRVKDSDESYAGVSVQIQVQAPLYKMDIITGNTEGTNSAWGTKDYAYFYQDFNGFDQWKKLRVDYCYAGTSVSGVPGTGSTCPSSNDVRVAFGDFWHDGTLGVAESFMAKSGYAVEIYRRAVDASGAVIYLPSFNNVPAVACTAIAAGDVTGDGIPEVVCGGSNGWVWYYNNNGNWTTVFADQPSNAPAITSIAVADFNGDGWNDIAVAGANGYLKYYPNLGYGRFQNSGINDNWFAVAEETARGNVTSGSYLSTYVADHVYETVTEQALAVPLYKGGTVNAGLNTTQANWTFASAYNGATGLYQSSGGNPGGYAQITDPFRASSTVAGYWYQAFTVPTGSSGPYTVTASLDYELTSFGATSGAITFYAFVDTTSGPPPLSPTCSVTTSGSCWSSGALTATRAWTSMTGFTFTGRVSAPGTYYLKVAMYSTYQASGGNSVGGFDNIQLSWQSTSGTTSALRQYWRMNQMPTRAGTAFTFTVTAHATNIGTDQDFYTFAYATNVASNDPTTGTYTTMVNVTASADQTLSFPLPSTLMGQVVWIRAVDTNRTVGPAYLDSLSVDQMYINANTPQGTTGAILTNPGDASTVNSIDAQDQNADHYWDLVVGTANGHVFRYMGSATGLQPVAAAFYTAGGSVTKVRFGNFSTTFPGLEIALATGTTITIIRGDTGTLITAALPSSPSTAITSMAVGDINGDGWDDVVCGTAGGTLLLWENLGQGTSWAMPASPIDSLLAPIYSAAVGDTLNSAYLGR